MKRAALFTLTVALAACQGSVGSTPPVAPPNGVQPNSLGQVPGVGGPGASRAQTQEAVVKYTKDLTAVVFPSTEGYGLQIVIASPAASSVPSSKALAGKVPVPGLAGSPSPAASGSPAVSPSSSPSPAPSGGSPSASPSAAPSASPSASPAASPSGKKSPAPPITVKLTVYPDLAPVGPTPDPDASPAPTPIANRVAIVRGYFKPPVSFTVTSLDAFRFTLPADEIDKSRGYTVALFSVPDKNKTAQSLLGSHKDPSTRLAFTTAPVVDGSTIHAGTKNDPIELYAGVGYAVILYGDPRAVAAPAAQAGVPGQGTYGQQGAPAAPGAYGQQGAPSPLPFNQAPGTGGAPLTGQPYPYGQTPPPGPISTVPPHP